MDQPYLDTVIYDNFCEMLKGRLQTRGKKDAIRFFEGETIRSITYREMTEEVASVYAFYNEKIKKGGHIGIISENRYEYIPLYLAAVFDHVIVPLDKEMDASQLASCIRRFDLDAILYTDRTEKKVSFALDFPENSALAENFLQVNIDTDYSLIVSKKRDLDAFFASVQDTDKDRFAVLASTSGTDGEMKGVMLSQYNVITNIRGTLENNVLKNPTLAFLPMNHTYGFHPCILATLYNGTTVCLNLEIKHLARDLKTFDPYFFGAVPMVIEGLYDNIIREVKRQGKEEKFYRLIKLSDRLRKGKIDLRHLFFGRIINKNLRLVVNGGAPLEPEYVEKFDQLGIQILNGYGMTECSPTVAVSRSCNNIPGSAGTIMKHIDVKIAEDGEILVKGPCVMLGYYKDEEATKACMRDGYFATGDLGHTEGKVIFVSGRKKNLIILENGKNVAPEYLERMINKIPGVKESLVVPHRVSKRNHVLMAKIVLEDPTSEESRDAVKQGIRNINTSVASYMRIEEFSIMDEPFEKTGSQKIKRRMYMEEE